MAWNVSAEDFEAVKHMLPDSMLELMQVIGFDATYTLVKRFGGINIPVGMAKTPAGKVLHARLSEEIGEDNAYKVSRIFGHQRFLWVPKCQDAMRELRNRKIRAELDRLTMRPHNYSMPTAVRTVALDFGLTERQIWYIAKETDIQEAEQGTIF